METLIHQADSYLHEVIGSSDGIRALEEKACGESGVLPFYLQNLYSFSLAQVLNQVCLLMLNRAPTTETPAVVRKHWEAVSKHYPGDVIYVVESISSYNRKRLIEQRVPFIVPGNQLYIPMLGVDLREHFKQSKKPEKQWLSAAAQVLVLKEIFGSESRVLPSKELAELLGYSAMTLTRAIKELVDRELATAEMVGREKRLKFNYDGQELWLKAKSNLHNPIKKRVWITNENLNELMDVADAKIAGDSALAKLTMIADPNNLVLAISAGEWPGIRKLMDIYEMNGRENDAAEIQLWRYSPTITTTNQMVDPLSLWLSFKDTHDERIEMARDTLLEKVWGRF